MIGATTHTLPVLHEKAVTMEVGEASRKPVQLRNKSGRGEARPKSLFKSIFSRKSTKSQDDSQSPPPEEPKKKASSKRRLASDRAARAGIMWNEGVQPVSGMVADATQALMHTPARRGMSVDEGYGSQHSQHLPGQALLPTEGAAVTRNHSVHATRGSDPRTRSTSTPSPVAEHRTVDGTGSVDNTEITDKTTDKTSKKGRRRGSGAPSPGKKLLSISPSLPGGRALSVVNSLGVSSNKPPMGHRKPSFSEDVLAAIGMDLERGTSMYIEYDDEAFCIDGWHSDDDSLEEFSSDEDLQGSDCEDSVDGPSAALTCDTSPGGEGQKLRTIDESKAIPKFQRVAMEILSTECTYVKRLSMLESLRRKLKESNALTNEALDGIFVNLPNLLTFHQDNLLPQLQKRIDKWDKVPRIGDVMKEFAPFLKLYTPFVKNIDNARKTLGSLKKTPKAGLVITEFEKSSESGRIPMADYLTEPMTRLLRYKLLLGEYLRKLPEGHMDRKHTEEALDNISEIATHVNESIRAEDNMAKTLQIKDSLQGDIDLVQPHRTFVKEGRIAMVNRAKGRHLETHIYLFSDLLLVCQPPLMGAKYKIHTQLTIKGLKVERDDDNHFTVSSRKAVVNFFGSTQREANEWEKSIRGAINKYKETHTPAPSEAEVELELEEELGYRAPHLVRKDTASQCSQCCLGFKSLRRPKNHCFACGQLFCPRCSNRSLPLAYDNWQNKRVCDRCFSSLRDDAVCKSVEDLTRDDWTYGDLLPRVLHYSDL